MDCLNQSVWIWIGACYYLAHCFFLGGGGSVGKNALVHTGAVVNVPVPQEYVYLRLPRGPGVGVVVPRHVSSAVQGLPAVPLLPVPRMPLSI